VEYTWDNGQIGDAIVKERLDIAFDGEGSVNRFGHSRVRYIVLTKSDHLFVALEF
jgi:hypothetical protein